MQNCKLYPIKVLKRNMPCSNISRKCLHSTATENNISVHVRGNIIQWLAFLISRVKCLPEELKLKMWMHTMASSVFICFTPISFFPEYFNPSVTVDWFQGQFFRLH